jgi:acetyltransferase-like isoleucine patch superfamily enzyme
LQIQLQGKLTIGDHFNIRARQFPVQITVREGGQLVIGDRVFVNQGVNIIVAASVAIGDDCKIADLASIRDTDTHQVDPMTPPKTAPVVIGRNVWIGRAAVIMPGVTIGENVVVAAGAVVVRDVPSNSVVAGVPAREVRRFDAPSGWVRQ